jgi:release factor glutamine methyltransferase
LSVDGVVTWRVLWQETSDAVGDRHRARWLCEVAASAASGDEFLSMLDDAATDRMLAHLDAMLARYAEGEPLQYVLGQWSFRRIELAVDRRVLIPRPETELVAGAAIELARTFGPTRTIADVGTGSGAIGLALADELPLEGTTVWLTDVDEDALHVARANLAGLGRTGRNVRVAAGSWLEPLDAALAFDVIVSNPPYVAVGSPDVEASVVRWEPHHALFAGPDGLDAYRQLVPNSHDRLRPGGWLVLEIGSDQGETVSALLEVAGYADIEIRPDLAGHDRIAIARRPHAAPG